MIELTAREWFTLTGRGPVAVIDATQLQDALLHVGDHVRIDGTEYLVKGIGGMRVASGPEPFLGILVAETD